MANPYVKISNTGSTAGYKIVPVENWQPMKPDADIFTGLDGDTTISIGAAATKWEWQFTALVQSTAAAGTAAWIDMQAYLNPTSAASAALKFQSVEGVDYDVAIPSGYQPTFLTNGVNGDNEYARLTVRVRQR